jgi:hypothetical protein
LFLIPVESLPKIVFLMLRSRMKSGYSFGNTFHICTSTIGTPGVLTATSVRKFRALCDSVLPPMLTDWSVNNRGNPFVSEVSADPKRLFGFSSRSGYR